MQRVIDLKHVGPKTQVRRLIEELIDRLEDKLQHFPSDALSVHVLFEANGSQRLYRVAVTCHVPGYMVAAHEENRDPGVAIRKTFDEVERQLLKRNAMLNREHRRQTRRKTMAIVEPPDLEPR